MVDALAPPGAMVRVVSEDERAYARRLEAIEVRRRDAADLQADLESLKLVLGRFEAEYHARVGVLFVELDRVRLAIDEYSRRVDRLRADRWLDLIGLEQEIEDAFAARRQEVRDEQAETNRYREVLDRERQRPQLDAEDVAEAKRLYRELARRYHPDLARTDADRTRRQEMMLRVNDAFRERDLTVLRALHRAGEIDDPAFEAKPIGEKLAWAEREVARLDAVIADMAGELSSVRESETHRLWARHQADAGLLDTLAADLTAEVAAARERLAEVMAVYQALIVAREAA